MDRIINYLLLIIIFVFDPLAIALVIAANYAFEQIIPKTKNNIYGEKVVVEETNEEEWDEDHALDTVLNDIVSDEDWEVVDDEKPFDIEEKIKQINTSKLSAYGKKKAIRKVKKDNLTKIY